MPKSIRFLVFSAAVSFPLIAFAETQTLKTLILTIVSYFSAILALLMGLAVVMFVFYVIKYFMQPAENRTEAWQYVLWSLIGFFIIFSMWGLVSLITNTFNLGQNTPSVSSIFPTDSGSVSSGSNIFNQGVPIQPAQITSPSNTSGSQNISANPSNQEIQQANANDLSQYNQNINNGVSTGDRNLTTARAIDLANKNGVPVYQNSTVQFSTTGGVPTSITVDGKNVPINQSSYTQTELNSIKTAQSVRGSLGQ